MNMNQLEEDDYYIGVPQAGYAWITPSSPPELKGALTEGLSTCCSIAMHAKAPSNSSYHYFCHADASTDLSDEKDGLSGRLRELPKGSEISIAFDAEKDWEEYFQDKIDEAVYVADIHDAVTVTHADPHKVAVIERNHQGYASGAILDEESLPTQENCSDIQKMVCGFVEGTLDSDVRSYPPICVCDSVPLTGKDIVQQRPKEMHTSAKHLATKIENQLEGMPYACIQTEIRNPVTGIPTALVEVLDHDGVSNHASSTAALEIPMEHLHATRPEEPQPQSQPKKQTVTKDEIKPTGPTFN